MLDDLAMLPGNILVSAEIPAPELSGTSPWPPADAPGQLTFILVGQPTSPAVEAAFLGKHVFDHPITPSSVTVYQDEHGPALYVTDYFHGGLHRVSAAEWRNAGAIGGVLGSAAASTR